MPNQTKQDAFDRIADARIGSLVNPSEEYLLALYQQIENWGEDVRQFVIQMQNRAFLESANQIKELADDPSTKNG